MAPQYITINADGNKFYYKDRAMTILHREDGPAVEFCNGYKAWFINGVFHRINGPAVEYSNGSKEWWVNGKRHREDGPAVKNADGTILWYLNGVFHRENGPAAEWCNGEKSYYIHGKRLTEEEFKRQTAPEIVLTLDEIASKLGIDVGKLKIKK